MIVLRSVALVFALALMAAPAVARIDDFPPGFVLPSPQQKAVGALLAEATDAGDPIEAIVLDGVRHAYEARDFDLIWLTDRNARPQMVELRSMMDQASVYGLDPASYPTPDLAPSYPDDVQRLAQADVEFSRAVGRFVTHISSGRIQPTVISKLITLEPERPDIGEALVRLSRSTAIAADLRSFEPSHRDYRALKSELARLRALPGEPERIIVPEGDLLKPGKSDDRVPLLRTRLGVSIAADAEPNVYDDALVEAVEAAQAEAGLNADGVVGPQTLGVLNGRSREEEIASVIANLERWRWMPRDLGA
ncbi:MAG: peptidoglycan-binding protein, partial [Rhizobiaceae bacterium]|nr:peptidoglycan-binding protein [Rhizobiaceae bacterium]